MNIILFGGTGTIGQRIYSEAVSRGHQVALFVRPGREIQLSPPPAKVFKGDLAKADVGLIDELETAEALRKQITFAWYGRMRRCRFLFAVPGRVWFNLLLLRRVDVPSATSGYNHAGSRSICDGFSTSPKRSDLPRKSRQRTKRNPGQPAKSGKGAAMLVRGWKSRSRTRARTDRPASGGIGTRLAPIPTATTGWGESL